MPNKIWNSLAYCQILKKYAIVRTLSVCPCRYYFSGGWPILPVYGSIEILAQGMNQGRNFIWIDPSSHGRGAKSKFHIFSYKNRILLVFKSDVGPGGGHQGGHQRGSLKPSIQRPETGPRDQFFWLLGIYFINMELIWPDYFSHTVLEF